MVYNYTKPRGPIAAMYSSPGPCYALPGLVGQKTHDPRSEHNKGPAYPFGVRHGKFFDDCSPGPCYYPNPKCYRDGLSGVPHYSLYSRTKDAEKFKAPGPGAYSPEKAGQSTHYKHPSYVFGSRFKSRRTDNTPAPNNYTLPFMIGKTAQSSKKQAPCYSLTGRSNVGAFCEDLAKTPGPGTYQIIDPSLVKGKAPHYSMTSRNVMPGDTTQKPGPGAHSPEGVWTHKVRNPQYSFGIRHTQYEAPLIVEVQD
ncbi:Outer dense fiber protein 3 [Mactra antiquata]